MGVFRKLLDRVSKRPAPPPDRSWTADGLLRELRSWKWMEPTDLVAVDRVVRDFLRARSFEAAHAFLEQVIALCRPLVGTTATAELLSGRALLFAQVLGAEAAEHELIAFRDSLAGDEPSVQSAFDLLEDARGHVRQWAGDFQGAFEVWSELVHGRPSAPPPARTPYREAAALPQTRPLTAAGTGPHLLLARVAIDLERYDEAERVLQRIATVSGDVVGRIAIGSLLRERGDPRAADREYDEAEQEMDRRRIPASDGRRAALAHARARARMLEEQWDRAEHAAMDALLARAAIDGDDAPSLSNVLSDLATIWMRQGRIDEAGRASRRARDLATGFRLGALEMAEALTIHAEAHRHLDPTNARVDLEQADALLAGLAPTQRRRLRIARAPELSNAATAG